MLSAVLVVSQLVRLSEVLINFGLSIENILLPFLFIILPFLSFTIPMAYLFAVLISFSRLSTDGEFTALLAAGYSLSRAAKPVLLVGLMLYLISAWCGLSLEPWGRRELVNFYHRKAQGELDNMIKYKMKSSVFIDDFLGYVLYAEKMSPDRSRFDNVLLAPGRQRSRDQNFTLLAPSGSISGTVEDNDLKMTFDYGIIYSHEQSSERSSVVKFKRAEIDLLRIFQNQILGSDPGTDYRALPPGELWDHVDLLEGERDGSEKADLAYWKARYLFHQRASIPFSALTFCLFAMVLGIHDPRRGKSGAYVGAIVTVVGGYVVMMFFKWLGENGYIAAPFAAWIPNILLFSFGAFLVFQKNRLPPSESTLDPKNIPLINRLFKTYKST